MSPPAGSGELSRHIMHCGRVQKCALEALIALSSSPGKYVRQQQNSQSIGGKAGVGFSVLYVSFSGKGEDG